MTDLFIQQWLDTYAAQARLRELEEAVDRDRDTGIGTQDHEQEADDEHPA